MIKIYLQQSMQTIQASESQNYITGLCRQTLSLFLSGNEQKTKQKLSIIYQLNTSLKKEQKKQSKTEQKKDKFAYEINFEEQQQQLKNKKAKPIKPKIQASRKSQYCQMCPQNQQMHLLSASNFVYLALPKRKTFKKYPHYIIAPVDHFQTRIGIDQQIAEQIKNYQKCLIQMLESMNLHAIFIQQFSSNNSHIYLQCIGVPLKKAYDLPFFFKQALENVQSFWATHKKIIQIRKQKGGLQKQIPKQIKYFYIDFGVGYGYAHAIEDQKYWDRNFCYEIVAAALNMQTFQVKTTQEYGQDERQIKSKEFQNRWKTFDWTVLLENKQ